MFSTAKTPRPWLTEVAGLKLKLLAEFLSQTLD